MKTMIFIFFLTIRHGILQAQTFEFFLNDPRESEAMTVCEMGDSYIIGGSYEKISRTSTYAYLIRLDQKGDTIWTQKIGGVEDERDKVVDLQFIDNNQFVMLSDMDEKLTGSMWNQQGNELWIYTDSLTEEPVSIARTSDDDFVLCGSCRSKDANEGRRTICVIKLDKNGKPLWSKFVGQGERLKSYTIAATPGGGILVNAYHRIEGIYEPYLISLNEQGEEIWQKSLAGYGFDYAFDMKVDEDGNIYLAGDFADRRLPILAKLNPDGNLMWKQVYEGEAGYFRAYALTLTRDRGCILAGRTTDAKGFLLKTDQKGNQQWLQIFAGIEKAGFQDVIELKAGGYIAVGVTLNNRISTAYIIKTDEKGNL